jgi:small subunit ribosomal protein S17
LAKSMRKVRTGSVVRVRMDRTAVVEMVWKQRNRLYRKQVRRLTRFMVHDPENRCQLGDTVRIEETRPISKTKHWRLMEILDRRQVAEVQPIELEADAEVFAEGDEDQLFDEENQEEEGDEDSDSQEQDTEE